MPIKILKQYSNGKSVLSTCPPHITIEKIIEMEKMRRIELQKGTGKVEFFITKIIDTVNPANIYDREKLKKACKPAVEDF